MGLEQTGQNDAEFANAASVAADQAKETIKPTDRDDNGDPTLNIEVTLNQLESLLFQAMNLGLIGIQIVDEHPLDETGTPRTHCSFTLDVSHISVTSNKIYVGAVDPDREERHQHLARTDLPVVRTDDKEDFLATLAELKSNASSVESSHYWLKRTGEKQQDADVPAGRMVVDPSTTQPTANGAEC